MDDMTALLQQSKLNASQLARVLRCCPDTARTKLRHPERLTLGDLRDICLRGGVPAESIREAIRFGGRPRET